jgi:hypothetical protein
LSEVGREVIINIDKLITYGNVDKNLKNPKTDLSVQNDKLKYIVLEDYSLDCEYLMGN